MDKTHNKQTEAEWILDGGKMVVTLKYKCSKCKCRSAKETNYCPNCGSRMGKARRDYE